MSRLATTFAVLLLAFPGAAFAQGAGDDQYQDPFGDEPTQSDSGSGSGGGSGSGSSGGGLSDSPPVEGSGSSSGGSTSGSGGGTAGTTGTTDQQATAAQADEQPAGQLPNTGSDPRVLLAIGSALLLMGIGLRLRTIDPNDF